MNEKELMEAILEKNELHNRVQQLEEELQELKSASKAIYQIIHCLEDNDGRIKRFRSAIFTKK